MHRNCSASVMMAEMKGCILRSCRRTDRFDMGRGGENGRGAGTEGGRGEWIEKQGKEAAWRFS
jgi:hypothetical protein